MAKLDDIIRRKAEDYQSTQRRVDWTSRRTRWIREVDQLFTTITQWVQPHIENHVVTVQRNMMPLTEQYLGTYDIAWLRVLIAGETVTLLPKATLIVGACGRVDMKGPDGEVMFVLQDPRDVGKGTPPNIDWNRDRLVWQIPRRAGSRVEYIDLTQDTFALSLEQ